MVRIMIVALGLAALTASAAAFPVASSEFSAGVIAMVDGAPADIQNDTSPPNATPLILSATAIGGTDLALAGSQAGPGLLSAYAESSSAGASTPSAQGTASYRATWNHTGAMFLNFDFTSSDFTDPGSLSFAELMIHVTSGGLTVFDEVLSATGSISELLFLGNSPDQVLEVKLTSRASGASAFNSALLAFDVALVPEPGTLWLIGPVLFVLFMRGRRALIA